jgi:hypothetical protein
MMFMIPIPPTMRLTAAIPASRNVSVLLASACAVRNCDRSRIRKSLGWSGRALEAPGDAWEKAHPSGEPRVAAA